MKWTEKARTLLYYYTHTPKGRFELSHYRDLLVLLGLSIAVVEVLVVLWRNG